MPRGVLAAGLVATGFVLAASDARADDAPMGAKVEVSARISAVPAPDPDASDSELQEYFSDLRDEIANVRARLRAAEDDGDEEAEATLQADLDAKLQFFQDERKRLDVGQLDSSFDNRGVGIAGIVLLVVGGVSALTSLGFAIGYGLTDLEGDANEQLAWTSLGFANLSVATFITGAILYSVSGSPALGFGGVRVAPWVALGSGPVGPGLVLGGEF